MENQTKKRKAPKSGNGGKKNKKEVPLQFEVDYIFGKRADKFCKGKVEYRVFWKGYAISDASWEPEDNLRHCNEAIEKYERSQGLVQTKASKLEKDGKLEDLEKDSKQEGTSNNKSNGKKKGRKGKKRGNSVGLDKKNWTKKQKLEEPPRARSSSVTKRKGSNTSNDGKTTNSFSSKDTTPLRSNSVEDKDKTKADAAAVPEEKHLVEHNENRVLTKKHSKLNVQDISLITSVHPSGIEGIMDLVADVVMKDGSIKSVASETLKREAPRILIDYYERALELKD